MKTSILHVNLAPSKIALINLGCARNLVDAQIILGHFQKQGHRLVDISQADTVIVNTCGFIEEAKQETIDTLLEVCERKRRGLIKTILVCGCFSERYPSVVAREFPGLDFIGGILALQRKEVFPQVSLSPRSYAYLKICESCYHHCSFCAIPKIKGKFVSRYPQSLLTEFDRLDDAGVTEVDIIGQDITAYGRDLKEKTTLAALLARMARRATGVRWIRLLYSFPAHITDELISVMARERRICRYLDLPLQHVNARILASMNRRQSPEGVAGLIEKLRRRIPGLSLRSAFIVGYPGETHKEFKELCSFIQDFEFDRLGVFIYSREEGTRAARLTGQVPRKVKEERYNILMGIQKKISQRRLMRFIGQTMDVLIDAKMKNAANVYEGRTEFDAPEVDGLVFVHTPRTLRPGDLIKAKITDSCEYDLIAKL